MSNNSYSTNNSVPPSLNPDAAFSCATFGSDVQLGNSSYVNLNVAPTVIVPSTVVIGDALAQIQFFSVDGGLSNAYSGQAGTSVGIVGTAFTGSANITGTSTYIILPTVISSNTLFAGYTVPQVVQSLINYGLLAGTSTNGTN